MGSRITLEDILHHKVFCTIQLQSTFFILGQLDQWSDHLPHKQQAAGSSPALSMKGMAIWNLIINHINGKENARQY